MKTSTFCFMWMILAFLSGSAQWTGLRDFNGAATDLLSFDGKLFMTGFIGPVQGGTPYPSFYYDGNTFVDQTTSFTSAGYMAINSNHLYCLDGNNAASQWNGANWGTWPLSLFYPTAIYSAGDTLFFAEEYEALITYTTDGVTKDTLPRIPSGSGSNTVVKMIKYNGDLIVAGDFSSSPTPLNSIARWDGTSWQQLGNGLTGGGGVLGVVRSLAVYHNELYVGGNFTTAGGQAIPGLAKWNGSVWSMVGTAPVVTGYEGVLDMVVYNDALFVVGGFGSIGGVASETVAKWDGTNWWPMSYSDPGTVVRVVEIYNGKLYIGTYNIGAVEHFLRYDGSLTANEPRNENIATIEVSPNPSEGDIVVSWNESAIAGGLRCQLRDMYGRVVSEASSNTGTLSIKRGNFAAGTYILFATHAKTGTMLATKRIVLQ